MRRNKSYGVPAKPKKQAGGGGSGGAATIAEVLGSEGEASDA